MMILLLHLVSKFILICWVHSTLPWPDLGENQHKADLSIMPTQRLDASKGLSDAAVDGRILKLQGSPS